MIDWIATWKAIVDAWILQVPSEDPDWIGEMLCALIQCHDERGLAVWAEEVGMKDVERLIVRKES